MTVQEVLYEVSFLEQSLLDRWGKTQEELRQEQRDILFGGKE